MRTMIDYTCQHCGETYQRIKGNTPGKYCSRHCGAMANKPSQHLVIPDNQLMSARTLARRRKAAGLTKPINTNPFNEKFFDTWTDEMAWLLGLIWSDGCLYGNTIDISTKDFQLAELVLAVIDGGTYALKNNGEHIRVHFSSKHTADRLRSLGLTEHKSLTIGWPIIEAEYEGAFLRGLIDGDGSVLLRQARANQQAPDLTVQLVTASTILRDKIRDCLTRHDIAHTIQKREPQKAGWSPLYKFVVTRQDALKRLYTMLYPDEHRPCLHRKRAPYEIWMKIERPRTGRPSAAFVKSTSNKNKQAYRMIRF